MNELTQEEESRFQALVAQMRGLSGGLCLDCRADILPADVLYSTALGFKDAVRCLACLARGLKKSAADLQGQLLDHIRRRPCLRKAHEVACGPLAPAEETSNSGPDATGDFPAHADWWNAGNLGCGDLVLLLRTKLKAMNPGDILRLTALDPGAPEDIPSWCRLTGNSLLRASHPDYFIQRKG